MSDFDRGQDRLRAASHRADDTPTPIRSLVTAGLGVLAAAGALFLAWQAVSSLLVIFAGVLVAAFLDGCARVLSPVIPLTRAWRLMPVILLLTALLGLGLAWGAGKLPEQIRFVLQVMDSQLDYLQEKLLSIGIDLFGPEGGRDFTRWFSPNHGLFGHAYRILGTASGLLTNALVIAFLGILFAFDPASYRESIVMLVKPSYRARVRAVMDEMGSVLRLWFVGQVARMILMTICVWIALSLVGLPSAFVLGLQGGLSNFIPYLGPILAAIPVALVATPLGIPMMLWALAVYTIIQSIEGYMIGPLINRQAVEIPAAWTLAAIVLLGRLFGILGIALAMPLVAIARVAVLRFYVEDYLGDAPAEPAAAMPVKSDRNVWTAWRRHLS